MEVYRAGSIILVDWRGDALPKEPNKLRPCVVLEDSDLFHESFPNVIIVPIARHDEADFVVPSLSVRFEPTQENGCEKTSYAVAHSVATASKERVLRGTTSRITDEQLHEVRVKVAQAIGL